MSMLSKGESFSFQGIDLHAYDDVDKGQVYRKADLARKGKNNNWKKSYATLDIVADVYHEKLQDIFDFKLHKISDAKSAD